MTSDEQTKSNPDSAPTPKRQADTDAQHAYEPRFPNRNAGFIFIAISLFFTCVTGALLVIGLASNPVRGEQPREFSWSFAIVVFGVALVIFVVGMLISRRLLQNAPRRVVLTQAQFWVEDERGQRLVEIPYEQVTRLDEADTVLTEGQYNARYRGLVVEWQAGEEKREFLLSARNTRDFEEMMDDLFPRVPEAARGERTFDR